MMIQVPFCGHIPAGSESFKLFDIATALRLRRGTRKPESLTRIGGHDVGKEASENERDIQPGSESEQCQWLQPPFCCRKPQAGFLLVTPSFQVSSLSSDSDSELEPRLNLVAAAIRR
jgi:hypothetical protein